MKVYATVAATNALGMNTSATSSPISMDTTPPVQGVVVELSDKYTIVGGDSNSTVLANNYTCDSEDGEALVVVVVMFGGGDGGCVCGLGLGLCLREREKQSECVCGSFCVGVCVCLYVYVCMCMCVFVCVPGSKRKRGTE